MKNEDTFDVVVDNKIYAVLALEDETFDIYQRETRIGKIFPQIGINTELVWATSDLISMELAAAIGSAIEKREL